MEIYFKVKNRNSDDCDLLVKTKSYRSNEVALVPRAGETVSIMTDVMIDGKQFKEWKDYIVSEVVYLYPDVGEVFVEIYLRYLGNT